MPLTYLSYAERFAQKYRVAKTGCWIWTACLYAGSECRLRYGGFCYEGRTHPAHRISYILHCGSIPKGMKVLHKCDVPLCVNPAHLFLGTQQDNLRDMDKKGRRAVGEKLSRLTEKKVRRIRAAYDAKEGSCVDLGKRFKVAPTTLFYIVARRTWKHIK